MKSNVRYTSTSDQAFIDALKDLCADAINPSICAARIAAAYNGAIKEHKFNYWKAWTIYMDAATSLGGPGDDDEAILHVLVDTLIEISKLPDVVDEAGKVVEDNGRVYWRDVPEFTFFFRDAMEGVFVLAHRNRMLPC